MSESSVIVEISQIACTRRTAKPKPTFRKRAASPSPALDSDSDFTSSADEEGRQVKRRRKNPSYVASGTGTGGLFNVAKKVELATGQEAGGGPRNGEKEPLRMVKRLRRRTKLRENSLHKF
jgi:hypothetical protein